MITRSKSIKSGSIIKFIKSGSVIDPKSFKIFSILLRYNMIVNIKCGNFKKFYLTLWLLISKVYRVIYFVFGEKQHKMIKEERPSSLDVT
jgi:predicted RNA-binding protein associated with RNAse of E/G family